MQPNVEGIFYGLDPTAYHADVEYEIPSLSGSLCKEIINGTPRHCFYASPRLNPKFVPEEKDIFDRGSASHTIALGRGRDIVQVEADSWRTKEAKLQRISIRAAGAIPVLAKDFAEIDAMQKALLTQLDSLEGGNPFQVGEPEVAIYWLDKFALHGKIYSVRCRALLDWFNPESEIITDLKTSGGGMNPEVWMKWRMWDVGAPYQAAFTRRGLRRLAQLGRLPCHDPDFLFLLAESKEPYCCSLVNVPSGIRRATDKSADEKVLEAMATWEDCRQSGVWPGYGTHVHVAEGARAPFVNPLIASPDAHADGGHLQSQDVPDQAYESVGTMLAKRKTKV